jgi:DNA-binding transcriptional MerR regulator
MPSRTPPPDDSTASRRHSIDELSALAGVTPRTVRYYIAQGLLDHPEGAKRGAYYERRHVEQLLLIRRWTDAGLSLDRVRELLAGAPEDPPRRPAPPGSVEVWSRMTVADGLEVHLEPGRAGLSPEQVRAFVRGITALYRQTRAEPNPVSSRDES